jgi:hypothetical protein
VGRDRRRGVHHRRADRDPLLTKDQRPDRVARSASKVRLGSQASVVGSAREAGRPVTADVRQTSSFFNSGPNQSSFILSCVWKSCPAHAAVKIRIEQKFLLSPNSRHPRLYECMLWSASDR